MPKKNTFGSAVRTGTEPKSQIVANAIPVTQPKLKCIFVSDGVYKYVDEDGNDVT